MTPHPWICCQLGAREHYSIPRALSHAGVLDTLITDLWLDSGAPGDRLYPRRLRERFHAQLPASAVTPANVSAVWFEVRHALAGYRGWQLIVRRNEWFQRRALVTLRRVAERNPGRSFQLFSFSYAARRVFEFAKGLGWTTVLGQIDPGPPEERIVARLHREFPGLDSGWAPAPANYWENWRHECRLADRVVVNSEWSRRALIEEGVPGEKIRTIPVAYEPPAAAADFRREYPDAFTPTRPLRVLFLGQVNLRKGIAAVLDAVRLLRSQPVEFWFVGPRQVAPAVGSPTGNVRWFGAVPRGEVARFYQDADLFLFPTFSDGFGLTQLEAQAWKLPVIASRSCGDVVRDRVNGVVLPQVSAEAIAEAVQSLASNPAQLRLMSAQAVAPSEFGIEQLAARLQQAVSN